MPWCRAGSAPGATAPRRGREQLRGLSEEQVRCWREATEVRHEGIRTHEDEEEELGFFWAA